MGAGPAVGQHAEFIEMLQRRRAVALLSLFRLLSRLEKMGVNAGVEALGQFGAQAQGRIGATVRIGWCRESRKARLSVPAADDGLHQLRQLLDTLRLEQLDDPYARLELLGQGRRRTDVAQRAVGEA